MNQIPHGFVAVNKDGRRLDPLVELPAQLRIKENVQRLGDISVTLRRCAEHHLAGSCTDFLCGLNHAPLEKELLSTYEWVIRHSETCHMQSSCRNSKCLLGHVCQLPPCEYRGGSMPCRISPSLHFDDYAADRLESSDGPNPFDSVAATRTVHRQTSNAGSLHRTLSRRNSEPGGLGRTISARQSGSGSFVSRQSSTASKASQVSWDEEDEFDHVLQSISSELGRQVTLIRRTSPGSNVKQMFTSNGRARRDARHDMKKRLQSFQSRVRANLGMSDVKRQTSPSGHVSSQYLETRGTCYGQLLELRGELLDDLERIKKMVLGQTLDSSDVERMGRKLEEYDGRFTQMAVQMRAP